MQFWTVVVSSELFNDEIMQEKNGLNIQIKNYKSEIQQSQLVPNFCFIVTNTNNQQD